jgi:proline iminopeptidase
VRSKRPSPRLARFASTTDAPTLQVGGSHRQRSRGREIQKGDHHRTVRSAVLASFRTVGGRRLAFSRAGSGALLVCHGGGPGFSARYLGDLAGLGDDFELLLLDPRGTGGSDRPADARDYRIEDYVADVEELRRHLGEEQIHLFGHSHGGVVAAAYAAMHPERVERLVLASTLAGFQAEQEEAMRAGVEARSGEPWYADAVATPEAEQAGAFNSDEELGELALREFPLYFARYGAAEAAYLDTLRDETPNGDALLLFNREIFMTFDLSPQLTRITAPTLVITGDQDFIAGPACAADFDTIPHRQTTIVPGAGHFIFVEAAEAFHHEVRRFLLV